MKNLPIAIAYYGLILPISYLPFRILYILSDFLNLVLFKIIGYRKDVIYNNIKNSFPEKSENEIKEIQQKFYTHFCDIVVESLKGFTISEKEITRRMVFKNPDLANQFYEKRQSVIFAGGHYGNWEWIATSVCHSVKHTVIGIYQPIKNDFLNKKVNSTRSRFGLLMYSTKVVPETFEKYKNEVTATILAIDQSPGNPNKSYWLEFLNQDSATLFGTEKYAVKYNYPVIYGEIQRVKRGFYEVEFKLLCENPDQTQYGEITTMTMKMLEKTIQRKPENWLWTHKRWKHKRKKE